MEEQQHNIDEIFRQALGNYREAPPPAAWNDVEQKLDKDAPDRRSFFRWPWIALFLLLISGIWFTVRTITSNHTSKPATVILNHSAANKSTLTRTNTQLANDPTKSSALAAHPNAEKDDRTAQKESIKSRQDKQGIVQASSNISQAPGSNSNTRRHRHNSFADKRAVIAQTSASRIKMHDKNAIQGNKHRTAKAIVLTRPTATSEEHQNKKPTPPVLIAGRKNKKDRTVEDAQIAVELVKAPQHTVQRNKEEKTVAIKRRKGVPEQNGASGIAHRKKQSREKMEHSNPAGEMVSDNRPVQKMASQKVLDTTVSKNRVKEKTADNSYTSKRLIEKPVLTQNKETQKPAISGKTQQAKPTPAVKGTARSTDEDQPAAAPGSDNGSPDTASSQKSRRKFTIRVPLSLDVFGGYIWGIQKPAPNMGVLALQLSWRISAALGIRIAPAYRFGNIASQALSEDDIYGRLHATIIDSTSRTDSAGLTTYFYYLNQSYDSVKASAINAGGKYWDISLPLELRYQARGSRWFLHGGPTVNFGGRISTETGTLQSYSVTRQIQLSRTGRPLSTDSLKHYNTIALKTDSSYKPYNATLSPIRIGYTVGAGYHWQRLLVDVSLQQQLTGYKAENPALQKVYQSPYFRISIGYRILSGQPPAPVPEGERNYLQRL